MKINNANREQRASLLASSAEVQLIFCKDNANKSICLQ